MSGVDGAAQTALDIETARHNAKLNVEATRAFIHGQYYTNVYFVSCSSAPGSFTSARNVCIGGEDSWKAHQRVEAILSKDPVFDKSRR